MYKIILLLLITLGLTGCQNSITTEPTIKQSPNIPVDITKQITPPPEEITINPDKSVSPVKPIAEFGERITKKPFGIYITPETSPVQPERFSGYHNGVDVEYEDVVGNVPVYAVANGTVIYSGRVNGYGGLLAIQHIIDNQNYVALYGHLDPASLIPNGSDVKVGQQIAILGDGETSETDGERKHLHFSLRQGNELNLAGYVQTKAALDQWINPVTIIK